MAAGPGLTIDDWDEVLNLNGLIPKLLAGEMRPVEARLRLDSRRDVYPGVQLDYVRVLDAFGGFVDKVDEAIAEQNDALDSFNAAMGDIGETFPFDPTRLLTAAERAALETLQRNLKRESEYRSSSAEAAAEEAEALAEELESLIAEAEELEGESEALQEQIEDLTEELESMEEE